MQICLINVISPGSRTTVSLHPSHLLPTQRGGLDAYCLGAGATHRSRHHLVNAEGCSFRYNTRRVEQKLGQDARARWGSDISAQGRGQDSQGVQAPGPAVQAHPAAPPADLKPIGFVHEGDAVRLEQRLLAAPKMQEGIGEGRPGQACEQVTFAPTGDQLGDFCGRFEMGRPFDVHAHRRKGHPQHRRLGAMAQVEFQPVPGQTWLAGMLAQETQAFRRRADIKRKDAAHGAVVMLISPAIPFVAKCPCLHLLRVVEQRRQSHGSAGNGGRDDPAMQVVLAKIRLPKG